MLENQEDLESKENQEKEVFDFNVSEQDVIDAIKACLKVSPLINPSKSLINSVYAILKGLFIENKQYAVIEAPTGSGKTIIGFVLFFCVQYLKNKSLNDIENTVARPINTHPTAYFLTSNKLLQEQINSDLDRFDFRYYIAQLKGGDNYSCLYDKTLTYKTRPCKGYSTKDKETHICYSKCYLECPYNVARLEASQSACTVLNYAYFLNVMRSEFKPFFNTRELTICDEAHLIPDIVCNIFNFEFTQYFANQFYKLLQELELNFGSTEELTKCKTVVMLLFDLFKFQIHNANSIIAYYINAQALRESWNAVDKSKYTSYEVRISDNIERLEELLQTKNDFDNLLKRPKDIYVESELIAENKELNAKVYKHVVKDLSEADMVRNNMLSKLEKAVFMSATLGDIDEYAQLMGLPENSYVGLRLPSTFNWEKSPIYNCNSGWLNYNNFQSNIDKIIMDCLKICIEYHPKEKGIIHTSTFNISKLLQDKIAMGLVPEPSRFLFYNTTDEKEKCVEFMRKSNQPLILVGPSLYEGLDLKDDLGRFNILIKVPYAQMSDYVKKKTERFPFWYNRVTKEKIVQAIGRTNRHVEDYSKVYLLDSCFQKIIFETNDVIVSRLKNKKII